MTAGPFMAHPVMAHRAPLGHEPTLDELEAAYRGLVKISEREVWEARDVVAAATIALPLVYWALCARARQEAPKPNAYGPEAVPRAARATP